jgi:transcriptional regulator with XRE-family HTH domain
MKRLHPDAKTKRIAARIRRARRAARITQTELASVLGVAQSFIASTESGEYYIGPRTLTRIALALGTTAEEFER